MCVDLCVCASICVEGVCVSDMCVCVFLCVCACAHLLVNRFWLSWLVHCFLLPVIFRRSIVFAWVDGGLTKSSSKSELVWLIDRMNAGNADAGSL